MERRRASKGNTHDPYECCGKAPESGYGRPKGSICDECQGLIKDGKRFRAEKRQQELEVRQWTERDYAFPGYYGDFDISHEMHERLRAAMFGLVNAVSIDAPADTSPNSQKYEMHQYAGGARPSRHYLPWPTVLSEQGMSHDSWSWKRLVLINPSIREAIDAVDQVIRAALVQAYNSGKQRGASALKQLASGDMSLSDFEDGLVPRVEREARKSRR